jgi:cytosine/adenosine deaminase-related metal-dependent hydrolase
MEAIDLTAVSESFRFRARPDGMLAIPSPVNAHDHGYGIRSLDYGHHDDALEVWIPGLRMRPRTDPYLEALVAFARLAKTGVGATIHCHNSLNIDRLVEEAGSVIRAAGDVGIRLGLSCPLLDHDPWAYEGGPDRLRPFLTAANWEQLSRTIPKYGTPRSQIAAVDAVAAANSNSLVDVQYGPTGPQWCSDALLEAIAEASAINNRRIHMHLLESPRQRQWLDRRFPQGVVRYLDEIGFLSPRLAVAHGVQLSRDECELLAERGVQLVSNPSANLRLRSGIAPIDAAGCCDLRVAVGLDGSGFDDDQDLWREMRLFYLLHGGRGLERRLDAKQVFTAAVLNGAKVVNSPPAEDQTIVDFKALTEENLFEDADVFQVLMTRMSARYAKGLFVGNREIMRDGRLLTVDFDAARSELIAQARMDLPRLRLERDSTRVLFEATRAYYATW